MTRTVGSGLQLHFDGSVTRETTLWLVTRQDGGVLRLTSHDRDIVFAGNTYTAEVGYQRTDLASGATLAVNSVDIQGILNSAAISDTDLAGGRYDYAEVRVSIINWDDPDGDGETSIAKGWFGEIVFDEVSGQFTTELRGLTQLFSQNIIEQYGRSCRYDIGDARCTLPILPDLIQNSKAYAVGDVVRVARVGAANPTITEDFGDTNYTVITAGTTGTRINNFPTVLTAVATGPATLSVDDTNTISRVTGSFLDDGWAVDMIYRSTGFTNAANNGVFRIAAVTALTMDVTASTLFAESGTGDETLTHIAYNSGVELTPANALRVAGEVLEVISPSQIVVGPPSGGGLLATPIFIENPGFETGDFSGWTATLGVSTIQVSPVHGGAYSARMPNLWSGSNFAQLEQIKDVTSYASAIDAGGKTITVSWWQHGAGGAAGRIWVNYYFHDSVGALISSTAGTHKKVIAGVYQQQSQQNTIPALTRSITIEVVGGEGTGEPHVDDFTVTTTLVDPAFPSGEFNYGVLTFDSGLNAGLSESVKGYNGTNKTFTLYLSMPYPIAVGDKVGVHIGCNKELSRCIALDNVINHGGFPFIPGDDSFLRYPDSPY